MESFSPQLVMQRSHLKDLPKIGLPQGYFLRSFKEGDERDWERIIRITFDNPEYGFDKDMKSDKAFHPERVLFVTHGKVPVATASAWQVSRSRSAAA
jgi:hypothetical protein